MGNLDDTTRNLGISGFRIMQFSVLVNKCGIIKYNIICYEFLEKVHHRNPIVNLGSEPYTNDLMDYTITLKTPTQSSSIKERVYSYIIVQILSLWKNCLKNKYTCQYPIKTVFFRQVIGNDHI